jgi:hypothetical protein
MLYSLKQLICNDKYTTGCKLKRGKQIPRGKELFDKYLNTSVHAAATKQLQYFPGVQTSQKVTIYLS